MIGNDIIDINAAALESNPMRQGFREKIFSLREQFIIENSIDPVLQTWILWSMKESTYKAHQRKFNLKRKLNPLQLQVRNYYSQNTNFSGEVIIDSEKYFTLCEFKNSYIHCTATGKKNQKILNEILPYSSDLKTSLLKKLSSIYNLPFGSLNIIKNGNFIPYLYIKNEKQKLPFSLSHHGKFKAFSLPLMNY